MAERYYKGDGKFLFAPLDKNNHRVGPFRWVGDVSSLQLSIAEETIEHAESYSGRNQVVRKLTTQTELTLEATMHQFDAENIANVVNGVAVRKMAGSPVTDFGLGAAADLKSDDIIPLGALNLSAVTVRDSSPTPVVLEEGYNYYLNAGAGSIVIANLETDSGGDPLTLSGDLVADFTPGAYSLTSIMSTSNKKVAVRFEGLNSAEVDENGRPEKVVVEVFIVQWSPTTGLGFISQEFGSFTVTGTAIIDSNRPENSELGQFGYLAIAE